MGKRKGTGGRRKAINQAKLTSFGLREKNLDKKKQKEEGNKRKDD